MNFRSRSKKERISYNANKVSNTPFYFPLRYRRESDNRILLQNKKRMSFRTMPSNNEKKLKKFKSSRTYLIPQTFALSIIQSHKIIFPTMPEINLF